MGGGTINAVGIVPAMSPYKVAAGVIRARLKGGYIGGILL